jgi:hypothetical protein
MAYSALATGENEMALAQLALISVWLASCMAIIIYQPAYSINKTAIMAASAG